MTVFLSAGDFTHDVPLRLICVDVLGFWFDRQGWGVSLCSAEAFIVAGINRIKDIQRLTLVVLVLAVLLAQHGIIFFCLIRSICKPLSERSKCSQVRMPLLINNSSLKA